MAILRVRLDTLSAVDREWQLGVYESLRQSIESQLHGTDCVACGRPAALRPADARALRQDLLEVSERISAVRAAGGAESQDAEIQALRREVETLTAERDALAERVADLEAAALLGVR